MNETVSVPLAPRAYDASARRPRRPLSVRAHIGLYGEVIRGGFVELWAHKLRSTLTLTLLMLGVFALVVMTSVLDGVMDRIATVRVHDWDGTVCRAEEPETTGSRPIRDEPRPPVRGPVPIAAPTRRCSGYPARAETRPAHRRRKRAITMGVTHEYASL